MIVVASESVRAAEKATREADTRRRRREEARVKQPEGFIRTGLAMG